MRSGRPVTEDNYEMVETRSICVGLFGKPQFDWSVVSDKFLSRRLELLVYDNFQTTVDYCKTEFMAYGSLYQNDLSVNNNLHKKKKNGELLDGTFTKM